MRGGCWGGFEESYVDMFMCEKRHEMRNREHVAELVFVVVRAWLERKKESSDGDDGDEMLVGGLR